MAQILPHYSLCPLIEQESFLGLMKDVDGDTAVVTVNTNIIGRYKISDPKLLSSWNCKGRITSACIYDPNGDRYIAIFNENDVRIWTGVDENIDKVKKYRFAEKLYKLLICSKTSQVILVFRSGNVSYLDSVLEDRKKAFELQFLGNEDRILSCEVYTLHSVVVVFVIEGKNATYRVLGMSPNEKQPVFDVPFQNAENAALLGHCLLVDKNPYLVTLWSNGKLYRDIVRENTKIVIEYHCTSLENLDLKRKVVMKVLSPYYIAICGAKGDGILLIIYSTKFNLIQCQQSYESCQMLSQLWNFESKLFLIIGHNLVVAPYVRENRKLSTLVGSNAHRSCVQEQKECDEILSEAELCKNIVPALLEKDDVEGVSKLFDSHPDIPDSVLIDILFWSLPDGLRDGSPKKTILHQILANYVISDICKLRSVFNLYLALDFLDYIMTDLNRSDVDIIKLVKWASLFVDAFYSQFVMSNDTVIVEKLKSYICVLKQGCDSLDNYKQLDRVMYGIKRKIISC
jgi:hypothetical protein